LRIKEQGTHLTLNEYDDDDDDKTHKFTVKAEDKIFSVKPNGI